MSNPLIQVVQSVLGNLYPNSWSPQIATKQFNGSYAFTGGMLINWQDSIAAGGALNWSNYDQFLDINQVATTSSLISGGLTQVNAHDPQVCLHYLRTVALYKQVNPTDISFDGANSSGYMGVSQMVDHVTLCDFVPKYTSNQSGNKGYSNPKGWVYFACLDNYLLLKNSPLLSSAQVAALKASVLYQAWTYYNTWNAAISYDGSSILCSTSHSPFTYQPSQSLYMCAALLDAAQRFPNDIVTGMFYSSTNTPQSPTLWQNAALSSIPNILNRGGWSSAYNLFSGNMTLQPTLATDLTNDYESKAGDDGEAAISLLHLYNLTSNSAYLTQAQALLDSVEAKLWDATNGGYFFAYYTDGVTPPSAAYKECRASAHMLYSYYLYNQINPIYTSRQNAVLSILINKMYQTYGGTGYWYRTDITSSFGAYVDKYVNPFTDTLYSQANAGDTSVLVHTDVNIGVDTQSIIIEPRTTNAEELNFLAPAVSQGTATTLAGDTFVRANQSGWGTAADGETWTTLSGTGTLSIVSNRGQLGTPNSSTLVRLGAQTFTDFDILVRFSVGSLAHRPGLLARISGTNTYYQIQLVNTGTGIKLSKVISGVATTLITGTPGGQDSSGSANFLIAQSTFYWLRFRVQGSILAAKCWIDGTSEPSSYDVQFVDSSIAGPGGAGIVGLCTTSAPDTYDSFSVSSIPLPYKLTIDSKSNGGKLGKTHAIGTPIETLTFPTISLTPNVEHQYTTEAMCGVLVYELLTASPLQGGPTKKTTATFRSGAQEAKSRDGTGNAAFHNKLQDARFHDGHQQINFRDGTQQAEWSAS